jgi:hypothetical protein
MVLVLSAYWLIIPRNIPRTSTGNGVNHALPMGELEPDDLIGVMHLLMEY